MQRKSNLQTATCAEECDLPQRSRLTRVRTVARKFIGVHPVNGKVEARLRTFAALEQVRVQAAHGMPL